MLKILSLSGVSQVSVKIMQVKDIKQLQKFAKKLLKFFLQLLILSIKTEKDKLEISTENSSTFT